MRNISSAHKIVSRIVWAAATALVFNAAACGSAHKADSPQATVSGTVTDVSGAFVAKATVTANGGLASAVTDAAGHYTLNINAQQTTGGAVFVQADSYAPVSRQITLSTTVQNFILRPYDKVVPIVLPTGSDASVTASVARGDGTVTLTIPADSMVTSSGVAASGNAEVRLTYWNPASDLATAPGSLAARLGPNGNVVLALQSLGMVDVQVVQGTELLQVATGKSLLLDEVLPPAFKSALAQQPNGAHDPFLFYLDNATGLWVLDGNLTYEPTSGTLKGTLPHLTAWNYDLFENWNPPSYCTTDDVLNSRGACAKPETSDLGGCVTGRALQTDGTPLAHQTVRVWLFDFEHISAIDVTTDASGQYCGDVGIRLCVPYGQNPTCNYTQNILSYHLSSPASPALSSLTNPIPNSCSAQSGAYNYATYNAVQYFNDCGLINDDATSQTGNTAPAATPLTTSISACSYCSGQGPGYCNVPGAQLSNACASLPDVTFVPGHGIGTGVTPVCPVMLKQGDACNLKTAVCCPSGTVCSDNVCVPVLK